MFVAWNIESYIVLRGMIELISAVLFIVPRTASTGAFLLSAFLGGAIATHLINGEPALLFVPILFLILVWIAISLRYPKTCASLYS